MTDWSYKIEVIFIKTIKTKGHQLALSHFLKLKVEKQDSILQAALDEFSEYGYELASTNRIVERAGIAKGTLFKYFSSKEELFLYVCNKFAKLVQTEIYFNGEDAPDELFDYLKYITVRKMTLKYRFPKEFALITKILRDSTHPINQKFLGFVTKVGMQTYEQIVQRVKTSNFRPGVSAEEAFKLVGWTLRGFEEYILQSLAGKEYTEEIEKAMLVEFDRLCELLKIGLYKPQPENVVMPIPQAEAAAIHK